MDRLRPALGDCRLLEREPLEEPITGHISRTAQGNNHWHGTAIRLEGSCWRPAFIVAAACSEVDKRRGEPVGDSPRGTEAAVGVGMGASPLAEDILDLTGRAEDVEGGREFKSGAMTLVFLSCGDPYRPSGIWRWLTTGRRGTEIEQSCVEDERSSLMRL